MKRKTILYRSGGPGNCVVGRRAPTHVKQGVLIPAQALPSAVGQGREGYTGLLAASLVYLETVSR